MIPKKLQQTLLITATVYLALLPTTWATAARSIAFGVSVGLVLVTIAVGDRGRPESLRSPGTAILVTLGAWAASAMASVAWSVDPTYSASELRVELAWGVATMAIFYVATRDRKAWITQASRF